MKRGSNRSLSGNGIYYKNSLIFLVKNLSGNEVYYTIFFILPVQNMLCSQLHCQKYSNAILFSYKIANVANQKKSAEGQPDTVGSTAAWSLLFCALPPRPALEARKKVTSGSAS